MAGATAEQLASALKVHGKKFVTESTSNSVGGGVTDMVVSELHDVLDKSSELGKRVQLDLAPWIATAIKLTDSDAWLQTMFSVAAAAKGLASDDFAAPGARVVSLAAQHAPAVGAQALAGLEQGLAKRSKPNAATPSTPIAYDFAAALDAKQAGALFKCLVISADNGGALTVLSDAALAAVDAKELACAAHGQNVFGYVTRDWPCAFVLRLSPAQFDAIVNDRTDAEANRLRACRGEPPQTRAPGAPTTPHSGGHAQNGTPHSGATPPYSEPGSSHLSGVEIACILFGIFGVLAIGGALGYVFLIRQRRTGYSQLPSA